MPIVQASTCKDEVAGHADLGVEAYLDQEMAEEPWELPVLVALPAILS